MPPVILIGLPPGVVHSTVRDPVNGTVFEPNVTVEVDDATVERLKGVEQFGFSFLVGDPTATLVVPPPAVAAAAAPEVPPAPTVAADRAASPQ